MEASGSAEERIAKIEKCQAKLAAAKANLEARKQAVGAPAGIVK